MLKSIFVAGREVNYPRNQLMVSAIQNISQATVIGSQKSNVYKGGINSILRESIRSFVWMLPRLVKRNFNFIFIGFFGQLLVRLIAPLTKKPLILDMFVSAFDTLVEDRKLTEKKSLLSRFLFNLDQQSGSRASLIFVDTHAQAEYFHEAFGIPLSKMKRVFVGCDEALFQPLPEKTNSCTVLYYCSYLPLHGVDVVVDAAELLQPNASIKFKIIGRGMEFANIQRTIQGKGLTNIELAEPVSIDRLPLEIQDSLICLGGHFGTSAKACRVIPGKVFQMIAMGKPVIVGDNAANRELLTHQVDSWFCDMNNPKALADGINMLYHDNELRKRIADGAMKTYQKSAKSELLKSIVQESILETLKQQN
jgi:glycosyltransferase involved in cell wall biosynthesis